jgi:single-strand DNA-binding protein
MNKVILMGRLTRDPEMRQTTSGVSLARFSIAVNRRFSRDGQQQADFINCTAWRQTGEFICKYFRKGSMIAVVGSLQSRSWDGTDGQRHYATEVSVEEAYFTGSKTETGTAGVGYQQPSGADSYSQGSYQPQPQIQTPPQGDTQPDFDDFDAMGFSALDGSEDDLPF